MSPTPPGQIDLKEMIELVETLYEMEGASQVHYSQLKHTMTNKWEETQMRTFCTTETQESIQQSCDPPWDGRGFSGEILEEKLQNICAQTQEGKQQSCKCNLNSTDTYSSFSILFLLLERE